MADVFDTLELPASTKDVFDEVETPDVFDGVAPASFETRLSSNEEGQFRNWKQQYAPDDSGVDYDLRGAFKARLTPGADGHWPDTFKKPNHPTFSNESIYAKDAPEMAGRWEGKKYIPPPLSAGISGSEDLRFEKPPVEIPTLQEDDPRFPAIAADVGAGQAVMNQLLLPTRVDATGTLTPDERQRQIGEVGAQAEIAAQGVREGDPFAFETRADDVQAAQSLQAREQAMTARDAALRPETLQAKESRKILESNEAFKKYLNDTGQAPGLVGTFLEDTGSKFSNMGASILQTFAPSLGTRPAQALRNHAEQMGEVASINTGLTGSVGRGAGTVASLVLGGPKGQIAGLTSAVMRGALETHSRVLQETGDRAEADRQTLATYPALALYMLSGALGARLGGAMVAKTASPLAKGVAGFGGALAGNVAPSMAMQGEGYNTESAVVDTLLAIFHARGAYKNGVTEQQRAEAFQKLRSMGWSEERINAPFQAGAEQPASMAMRGPEEVQPFAIETSTGKPPQSVEVLAEAAPTAPSAPKTGTVANHDPDGLGAREWIAQKVETGVSREEAAQAWADGVQAGIDAVKDLPIGSIAKNRRGQRYVKTSDGWHELLENGDYSDSSVTLDSAFRGGEIESVGSGRIEKPGVAKKTAAAPPPLSPHKPQSDQQHIVSTAIMSPQGLVFGKEWNTEHRDKDFLGEAMDKDVDPESTFVNDLLSDKEGVRGFIIQNADGSQTFKGREGTLQTAIDAGQLPKGSTKINSQELKPPGTYEVEPKPIGSEGPGAAAITEPISNREPVGAWNAKVDEQRAARGLAPLASEARRADPETWDAAEKRVQENPDYGRDLVEDINAGKKESVSDTEQAALLREMIDLRNRRDTAQERALDEKTYSPEERAEFDMETTRLEERLQRTEEADRKAGTAQGRALRIRRLMAYEDFTLAGMSGKARRVKGQDLTPEETAELKSKAERFRKAQEKLEERRTEIEECVPLDEAIKAIESTPDTRFPPEVKSLSDRIIARLDTAASAALKRLREKGFQLGSAPDPTIVADLVIYGAAKIGKGLLNSAKWAASMVKDLGETVRPYLDEVWKSANAHLDTEIGRVAPKHRESVKDRLTGKTATEQTEVLGNVMKERAQAGEKLTDMRGDIQKLVENIVRSGAHKADPAVQPREALVTLVHDVLKGVDPTVTRRQVSDAVSGYGDFKQLSKDEIKTEVRDLKGQLQQVAKLEDIQSRKPLQKTGVERRSVSDEERRLIQQVNEAKKKFGVVVTDPETQLKSTLATMETRLTNRIKDLRAEIAAGERTVKNKTAPPSSARIEALRKELKAVEAEHDAAFGKRQMTDEQRLKSAIASAKRAEQFEQTRLENAKKGIFDKPITKPEQRSAELDAIKARTVAAREERKALEMAANPPLSKAQKALDAALVSKERWGQLLAGEVAPAKKMSREALSDLEADARAEIAAMRELAAEIRREAKPKADPDIATIKALEKAAAEYERRVNEADFTPKGKTQGPDTAKIAQARALRDAAKAAYDAALKARKPVRTKEEIAIQNYKARAARQLADLQDRIAKGDFATRPKKPKLDISKDPEAIKAEAEIRRVRTEFNQKQEQWLRDQRSALKKTWDAAAEVLASSRTLITSADLSAPFRQGGVFSIGDLVFNPRRLGRQLGGMLKSAVSETGFQNQEAALRLRPNAELYQSSGLYLADIDGRFTTREENMRSNLAEKIPVIGRVVRGSNRAYAGFLNRQRADAFDSFIDLMGGKGSVKPQDARFLAQAVNDLTGRGEVSKSMAGAMNFLSRYLFSPRFLISRFKTLAGVPIVRGRWSGPEAVSLRARAAVAMPYAKMAASLTVLYGLAKLAGAAIEDDPRSTDFGKLRLGNTRIDPLAGLQQYAVLAARTVTREQKDSKGKVRPIVASTFGNFARSKLAPIPGAAINIATGSNVVGEKTTALSTVKNLTVPISYQEVGELYEAHGATKASIIQLLNLLGFGTSHYGKK